LDIMKREVGRGVPRNSNSMVEMSLKLARYTVQCCAVNFPMAKNRKVKKLKMSNENV
jgi:predicted alpha/beta-hydrolase family hydrolase